MVQFQHEYTNACNVLNVETIFEQATVSRVHFWITSTSLDCNAIARLLLSSISFTVTVSRPGLPPQ